MKPTGRRVILEPYFEGESAGGILLQQSRHPIGGFVVSLGPDVHEDLSPEDFVLLENNNFEIPASVTDTFVVVLRDEDGSFDSVRVKSEMFHALQSARKLYERTGEDGWVRVEDIDYQTGAKFLISNIHSFETGITADGGTTKVEYTNLTYLEDGNILVDVNTILCTIK